MRVLLFIRSLGIGGAERQLVTLARAMRSQGIDVAVMTLYDGPLRDFLTQAKVPLFHLGKRGRWDLRFLGQGVRHCRDWRPDAIYCFGGAMLFAAMLRPFIGKVALIWGIRASNTDFAFYDRLSRLLLRFDPILARAADLVICNSYAGRDHVAERGFPVDRLRVVPNGIDGAQWSFSQEGRWLMRQRWGIGEAEILVGMVGRLDPIKDHRSFFQAVALCQSNGLRFRVVVVGGGPDTFAAMIRANAEEIIPGQVIWAGNCDDMAAAYSALDLMVQTSLAEGFPNVQIEAMACCVSVVATDAGDTRKILKDLGQVTPIGQPQATAAAIAAALSSDGQPTGADLRAAVLSRFGTEVLVRDTCRLIASVVETKLRSKQ
jgi:glycosyltransferase involved in cell wall biosynthesis